MILSYDYFDKLVARQCSLVWHQISKANPDARSPQKKLELGTRLFQLYYGAKNEFGTRIVEGFQVACEVGMPFDEIVNEIVGEFQKQAAEKARPKTYTQRVVPKTVGGVPIPFTVAHIEEFEDGKLISRRYRTPDGGISSVDVEPQYMMTSYQREALENPNARNIFKFLVSNSCAEELLAKLEEETRAASPIAPVEQLPKTESSLSKPYPYQRMDWNGTQKQLGELFVELKRKGWIDEYSFPAIKAAFTKSDSIDQTLRPGKTSGKEGVFGSIYTPNYKPCFDKIKRYTPDKPSETTKNS